MEVASSNFGTETEIGLGLIRNLLYLEPIFVLGFVIVGVCLVVMFKKGASIQKVKTTIWTALLYYYSCILFTNVVGIPAIKECIRLKALGKPLFNPNINFIPFSEGLSTGFILNIFLFVPLGFICPMISKAYNQTKTIILTGFYLSLSIEISQLFTLVRATDINDILANVIGTVIGYVCFKLAEWLVRTKAYSKEQAAENNLTISIPVITIATAFVLGMIR